MSASAYLIHQEFLIASYLLYILFYICCSPINFQNLRRVDLVTYLPLEYEANIQGVYLYSSPLDILPCQCKKFGCLAIIMINSCDYKYKVLLRAMSKITFLGTYIITMFRRKMGG